MIVWFPALAELLWQTKHLQVTTNCRRCGIQTTCMYMYIQILFLFKFSGLRELKPNVQVKQHIRREHICRECCTSLHWAEVSTFINCLASLYKTKRHLTGLYLYQAPAFKISQLSCSLVKRFGQCFHIGSPHNHTPCGTPCVGQMHAKTSST